LTAQAAKYRLPDNVTATASMPDSVTTTYKNDRELLKLNLARHYSLHVFKKDAFQRMKKSVVIVKWIVSFCSSTHLLVKSGSQAMKIFQQCQLSKDCPYNF
jgi:hypothetical protein